MNDKKPELIKTNLSLVRYKQDILDFADDIGSLDVHLGDAELLRKDFTGYLQTLINHDHGRQLPEGWVPHSMYWYINSDGIILGISDIRHKLTPALEDFGGHISYIIRPKFRNQGYATNLLASSLLIAQSLSISNVLLTTDIENIASRRVIEKNKGC